MIRKTALITSLSVAGVVLAGGAAIGASVGILNAADDNDLGQLTVDDLDTATGLSVETLATGAIVQAFEVDRAGSVEVINTDGVLSIGSVVAAEGWTAVEETTTDGKIVVAFQSGDDRLAFDARLGDDGEVDVSLDRVGATSTTAVTGSTSVTTASGSTSGSSATTVTTSRGSTTSVTHDDHDDDHDSDDDDHDSDHDDHDSDDDDHDDDHDEIEGADDDD